MEIPRRRSATVLASSSSLEVDEIRRTRSTARPVNRQLELPSQQVKGRLRSPLSGTGPCRMVQVKRRKSDDQLATSPADDAATTGTDNSTAGTSDEPQASTSEPSLPSACENDDEDETQDELTGSDQLKPLRLELTPESQLDSTDPVYVDLLDCSAPVTDVLKWLTSATWYV